MAVSILLLYVFSIVGSLIALFFSLFLTMNVLKQDAGNEAMRKIAAAIKEGAVAYLNRQYKTVAVITLILAVLIGVVFNYTLAITFVLGALFSAIAGYVGMMVSVQANVRTAQAATSSLKSAFSVAFKGGAVTGFAVAGLSPPKCFFRVNPP